MNRDQIAALAKGMVPFVRDCVTEAVTPLTVRIGELEARPIEKGEPGERGADGPQGPPGPQGERGADLTDALLPPELAEQVASAVRLLHESPPIEQHKKAPRASSPRVARIERDDEGNLVPIYDDQPV